MNRMEFLRWREAYEAAGIDPADAPPVELCAIAGTCGVLVASVAPRAIESARALAPGREVLSSTLLRELELHPPELGGVRLPLLGWAVSFGVRHLLLRTPYVTAEERERARRAAEWLVEMAEEHGSVVAVTHASFRAVVRDELRDQGWETTVRRRRPSHWSAWSFSRG
jgi:hypothetical protein